jgi:hypothetical protein
MSLRHPGWRSQELHLRARNFLCKITGNRRSNYKTISARAHRRKEGLVMRKARPLYLLLVGFLLLSSFAAVAQTNSESVLTNAGVGKMVKAGLPETIVIREIQLSRTSFDTSPAGLIDLRKHGASEAVLHAVLDSWNGGGMPMPAAMPGEEGAPRAAHVTGFHANVKINKKAHESITVGHNHVEVQGSGIPAISVEWQTNPPNH